MDQCKNCTCKGDLDKCMATECSYHELWLIKALRETMTLSKRLKWLMDEGCYPSIYRRGNLWRAHINKAGNFWADGESAFAALEDAVTFWVENGCPMDGQADEAAPQQGGPAPSK